MWQLQGFDSRDFVSRYWQKKPCVLRQALADFESPISPEELAGLACEPDVHARLVIENNAAGPWQLRYGPFEEADFLALPESHYSLLVSECEKWLPELTGLLDQFRFLPDWRIDDLMLSYAPRDGSVGPHVDQYDVFLLQAQGARRWQYGSSKVENPRLIPGLELAIMQDFVADEDIVLNPGDILYLPPGYAHHGIALEPSMTYSIGFRAPTAASALESFVLETDELDGDGARYQDPDLELDRHHAEITEHEIECFKTMAGELIQQSPELWRNAIGKMLSDSAVAPQREDEQPVYVSDLLGGSWLPHPETRLLFHRSASTIAVYYNGRVHELPSDPQVLEFLQQLCDHREWPTALLKQCVDIEPLEALLVEMATNGAIINISS